LCTPFMIPVQTRWGHVANTLSCVLRKGKRTLISSRMIVFLRGQQSAYHSGLATAPGILPTTSECWAARSTGQRSQNTDQQLCDRLAGTLKGRMGLNTDVCEVWHGVIESRQVEHTQ